MPVARYAPECTGVAAHGITVRQLLTHTSGLAEISPDEAKTCKTLADAVARLPETADCFADFVTGYTFGMDHRQAGCIARTATDELREGKISLVDYFVRMARAESFRVRQ